MELPKLAVTLPLSPPTYILQYFAFYQSEQTQTLVDFHFFRVTFPRLSVVEKYPRHEDCDFAPLGTKLVLSA